MERLTEYHGDFNPRSREGSDKKSRVPFPKFHNFNPRSREGSDCNLPVSPSDLHAYFNPRSREGSDKIVVREHITIRLFQSTLPRGERLARI